MTLVHQDAVGLWLEPDTVPLRGTVIVLPGRGESPQVYERFGRRLAADSYRVHSVTAPSADPIRAAEQVAQLVAESEAGSPRVLIGSDAGAAYAAHLLGRDSSGGVSALILAGLPTPVGSATAGDWANELDARTFCGTHRARLTTAGVQPGALYEDIPAEWLDPATPRQLRVPVLGLHGSDDTVSPLNDARSWYARVPHAELVSIAGGRHDILNDQTHRSVAATVVLFLERLRNGPELASIAVPVALSDEGHRP